MKIAKHIRPVDRANRALHYEALADACRDSSLAICEGFIAAAVLPEATPTIREGAKAAAAILNLALFDATYMPTDSAEHRLALSKPARGTIEERRLAILLARRRLAIWYQALTKIGLVLRPLCAESSDVSVLEH